MKELLHLYSELNNEYISLRIKAANDETLLSAKSFQIRLVVLIQYRL